MNGNNSNNRSNMVSPEDLALGSTGFASSNSSMGGMQANPFSQSQQVYPPANSSSIQQQQNLFQPVNQVASTPVNASQQIASMSMNNVQSHVANTPTNIQPQVVNQPVNNVPQQIINQPVNNVQSQMMAQPVNNNFQTSQSQQFINEQSSFFLHPHPINESLNNKGENKNVAKALFIAMTFIFLIFGIATVYVINIPSKMECSNTLSDGSVNYMVTYMYDFKNETLKKEKVIMSIDLGSNYDANKDYYIEEGKKILKDFIDRGLMVEVIEQKPKVQIELYGEGETLMKLHNVDVYSALSYDNMKATAEHSNFVCK